MSSIVDIIGREIIDSRGNPTVECDVLLESGVMGRAAVPSGASTGSREAIELRDGDKQRYLGKGVLQAVENINTEISEAIMGLDATEQAYIDRTLIELDGTDNKARLGANAMLAVSMAVAKAAAEESGLPLYRYFGGSGAMALPVPMMNVINGGAHANNNLDLQEFMILPIGAPTFREAVRYGAEVFHSLKKLLHDKGMSTAVGDEGGFAPSVANHEAAIQLILQAIEAAGYEPGRQIALGLDCASSEFLQATAATTSRARASCSRRRTSPTCCPPGATSIRSSAIEDGMAENDWEGWRILTDSLGDRVQLVGDDLFVTNTKILQKGIDEGIANSILIKINQIGTLTETFAAIEMAKRNNYTARRVAPLRRDRRHYHRRYRGGDQCAADQDRLDESHRSHRQVQPAAADRRRSRRRRHLSGVVGVLQSALKRSMRLSVPKSSIPADPMRLLSYTLAALLVLLQYPLWLGKGGWLRVWELDRQVNAQQRTNIVLSQRNAALEGEVRDLRQGLGAVEERARYELGMVRPDELFVQINRAPPGAARDGRSGGRTDGAGGAPSARPAPPAPPQIRTAGIIDPH